MRILLTQRELNHRGGSEIFTIEIARELRDRGHEVAIFTSVKGDLVRPVLVKGVWVEEQLDDIPFTPDIIHGQHHLHLLSALNYFRDVPAISYCHGLPWVENPPLHPRILRYVAICQTMKPRLVTGHHIPADRIHIIENFYDEERFCPGPGHASREKKAVLYGNFVMPAGKLEMIEKACELEGYAFEAIGHSHGNVTDKPEELFQQCKAAFVLGRSAVEAMACGCAVIPLNTERVAPLVTPDNLAARAESNFCPRIHGDDPLISVEVIRGQLQKIDAAQTDAVTQLVRQKYTLKLAVDRLEQIYNEARSEFSHMKGLSAEQEQKALSRYLTRIIKEIEVAQADRGAALEAQFMLGKMVETASTSMKTLRNVKKLMESEKARTREMNKTLRTHDRLMNYLNRRVLGRYLLGKFRRKTGSL